jgi:hypothetical protein
MLANDEETDDATDGNERKKDNDHERIEQLSLPASTRSHLWSINWSQDSSI